MTPHQPAHSADLARLRKLATRMDSAFRLPIIGVRVGWDSIIGLIPGVGDAAALLPSAYIMKEAHRMGVPRATLAKMAANVGIDFVIGSVPLVGDLFDVGWKSHLRNVDLLEGHLTRAARITPDPRDIEGHFSSHHANLNRSANVRS